MQWAPVIDLRSNEITLPLHALNIIISANNGLPTGKTSVTDLNVIHTVL